MISTNELLATDCKSTLPSNPRSEQMNPNDVKNIYLSILRNKKSSIREFRDAIYTLGEILAHETAVLLAKESCSMDSPIEPFEGIRLKRQPILIPILRAGISLLSPFLHVFHAATVGFVGIRRQESTAEPVLYYQNLPEINPDNEVVVLDPMIATGGSLCMTLQILKSLGVQDKKIICVGVVAAPEGIAALKKQSPESRLILGALDKGLNDQKFIVPGLGDFGDRFLGTEH